MLPTIHGVHCFFFSPSPTLPTAHSEHSMSPTHLGYGICSPTSSYFHITTVCLTLSVVINGEGTAHPPK